MVPSYNNIHIENIRWEDKLNLCYWYYTKVACEFYLQHTNVKYWPRIKLIHHPVCNSNISKTSIHRTENVDQKCFEGERMEEIIASDVQTRIFYNRSLIFFQFRCE